MSIITPRTVIDWEPVLCDRFLKIRRDGDATPIRSFEITLTTLAEACGIEPSAHVANEMEVGLRAAFRHKRLVVNALEHGIYTSLHRQELPGCFTYLALTLYIDSTLDDEIASIGEYRKRLNAWLGFERSFSNLRGVAEMWRSLRRWLDERANAGKPFRRLILPNFPNEGKWSHIGYTRSLSFPARRDVRILERFLEKRPRAPAEPRAFIDSFRPHMATARPSWGLEDAFKDFETAWHNGSRALADHRFWRFVKDVARTCSGSAAISRIPAVVEMTYDEDGGRVFLVEIGEACRPSRQGTANLGDAVTAVAAMDRSDLAASILNRWIVFQQVGHGRWRSVPEIEDCVGRVLVGCPAAMAAMATSLLGVFVPSGGWALTESPVGAPTAKQVIVRLSGTRPRPEHIVPVSVADGIMSAGAWLGRPRFLPRIVADNTKLRVWPEGAHASGDLRVSDDGTQRLTSKGPVHGVWFVAPALKDPSFIPWTRRITFVKDAVPHETLGDVDENLCVLADWSKVEDRIPAIWACSGLEWNTSPSIAGDLFEAVYAGGRTGWDEVDLVELIHSALGGIVNSWVMLRCLRDASFIAPRLRAMWKGRVWSLTPPALLVASGPDGEIVIVQGTMCDRLVEDFRLAVAGSGGKPFRRFGPSPFAPPVVGCTGVDVERLSRVLNWPVVRSLAFPDRTVLGVEKTARRSERYSIASRWDWSLGRFSTADQVPDSLVTLTRWVHPGGRDHDVYVVETGEQRSWHLSRIAAIAMAHGLARMPLFRLDKGGLVREGRDGGLPDVLATWLRVSHVLNPGPTEGGYVYPINVNDTALLTYLIPGCVCGVEIDTGISPSQVVSSALHSGGRIRPTWSEGKLSAVGMPQGDSTVREVSADGWRR